MNESTTFYLNLIGLFLQIVGVSIGAYTIKTIKFRTGGFTKSGFTESGFTVEDDTSNLPKNPKSNKPIFPLEFNKVTAVISVIAIIIGLTLQLVAVSIDSNSPQLSKESQTQITHTKDSPNYIDYQFLETIILIIIPIGGSAFIAKWITNSWQIRSAKIQMKKEVLKSFQKSSKRIFVLIDTFVLNIADHYADYHNLSQLPTTGKIEMSISNFPSKAEEQPLQVFGKEYDEIKKEIEKTRFDSSKFLSNLRLYYNSEELEKKFQDIAHQLKYLLYVAERTLKANDAKSFTNTIDSYIKKSDEIKKLIKDLEKDLISSKLNEPKF
ncbi:MAG: hypothetical protein ABI340_09125 [Nitrososphaera sp.]|jgi:hypothetical protein